MSETFLHTASLGAVLSITTSRLVAPLDEVFALQDFLAGRSLWTHERGNGREPWEKAVLLAQFPMLAEAEPPEWQWKEGDDREAIVRGWVESVANHVGFDSCQVFKPSDFEATS